MSVFERHYKCSGCGVISPNIMHFSGCCRTCGYVGKYLNHSQVVMKRVPYTEVIRRTKGFLWWKKEVEETQTFYKWVEVENESIKSV